MQYHHFHGNVDANKKLIGKNAKAIKKNTDSITEYHPPSSCNADTTCQGNGDCNDDGTCSCHIGFYGNDCTQGNWKIIKYDICLIRPKNVELLDMELKTINLLQTLDSRGKFQ